MTKLGFRVIGWRYRDANPVAIKAGLTPQWIVVWQTEKPTAAWKHFEVEPIFQPSEIVEARALALTLCPELAQLKLRLNYFGMGALLSRLSSRVKDRGDLDCIKRALDDVVKLYPKTFVVVNTTGPGYSLEPAPEKAAVVDGKAAL